MKTINQEQERTGNRAATGWWFLVLLFAFAMLMASCNTEKKVNDWSIKNPDKFKQLAAVLAPCSDDITGNDTIYQTHIDTLTQPGITDTVRRNDTVYITKQLPGRTIYKTNTQTITQKVEDSRKVEACAIVNKQKDEQIIKLQTENKAVEKNRNNWRLAFFVLCGVIVGWTVLSKYFGRAWGWVKGVVKV